jgi:hydrogenase-4 component B
MTMILVGLGLFVVGAVAALAAARSSRLATLLGVGGSVAGCACALVPVVGVLLGRPAGSLRLEWSVPFGAFVLGLDGLSAFFLLPLLTLSALAALYGGEYLGAFHGRAVPARAWPFFALLVAGMTLVVLARNGVLFLVAWEVMSLAAYFLVVLEDQDRAVREAGWTYLVATHLGTAFLLVMFVVLGYQAGSLDFARLGAAGTLATPLAGLVFVLAMIGFGTKAGFMPLHVWLPEAHPAAPSHVSAVMSGVMIKLGIYGLLRTLTFLGPPPAWWGFTLVAVGLTSGVLGVLFALAQHDLKRLLAYHSVENIGIIALGIGVGLLGVHFGSAPLAVLGFAGALLHVVNHALFKGLLFLGAGAVLHATGTREMDHLGGLLKRMPWTGTLFLVGAAAICGLPPLNGFASEFLVFLGAYRGVLHPAAGVAGPALAVLAGLALIGGLAAACFAKVFGVVFLGEPRSAHVAQAHDPGPAMRLPMAALAAGCVLIGLAPALLVGRMGGALGPLTRLSGAALESPLALAVAPLAWITAGAVVLLALAGTLALWRLQRLARRPVNEEVTWDCGYELPTARMQYTASSFARPLTLLFGGLLRTRTTRVAPVGPFPRQAALATETPDVFGDALFRPAFRVAAGALARLRWLQRGRVQLYVLYILLTLVVLLVWKLR